MNHLKAGDHVQIFGPLGDLFQNPKRPSVFLAGGIGITPFRGMMHYAADTGVTEPIVTLSSARVPEEFAFRDEFDAIAAAHPNIEVRYSVTRAHESKGDWKGRAGRIGEKWIREALHGMERPNAYVVGHPGMAREPLIVLKERMGFSKDDLEYEFFMGFD